MSEEKKEERAVALREASNQTIAVLKFGDSPKEAAQKMVGFPIVERALVIGDAFAKALEGVSDIEADVAKEKFGRKIEAVLDELSDFRQTLHELIEKGDTEIVLNMVKGRAGEFSSTAEHLDADLIEEFFEKDADMNAEGEVYSCRLINVCWTFLVETPLECEGVNQFFLMTEAGQSLISDIRGLAKIEDEDAQEILRNVEEREKEIETE